MKRVSAAGVMLPCAIVPWASVQAQQAGASVISPVATLGKLAFALLLVLLVFWAFAKFMKQMQVGQGGVHSGLRVVGALNLGQRERVVVIQAGTEQLVLGVTSTTINTLHVLEKPLSTTDSPELGDFKQKLSAALSRQVKS